MTGARDARRADSLVAVWARRAVTLPLLVVLAAIGAGGAPLWLAVLALVDVVTGAGARLPRARAVCFFVLYLLAEVVGVVAAFALWLVHGGGLFTSAARFVNFNAALQRVWTGTLFGGACAIFRMRLVVQNPEAGRAGPLLLFVRHSSTADTVLAAAVLANPNKVLLRYVMKRELLWDPCLDVVGRRLPNAFIDRSGSRTDAEVRAVAGLAQGLDAKSGVLMYPEGTRFDGAKLTALCAKLAANPQARALAEIAQTYRAVLPPRLGGAMALLDAAQGTDVVFLDQTGFEGAATFATFWSGALIDRVIAVRLRRVPAADVPKEGRDAWLFRMWQASDDWVVAHRDDR